MTKQTKSKPETRVRRTRDIRDLKGFLPKPRKAITIEEMDTAIRKGVARDFKRGTNQ